ATVANCRKAATANCGASAKRIDADDSGKSGRAAGESKIILVFGKRGWHFDRCGCGIAAFERSSATFETSVEHAARRTPGRRAAHASRGRGTPVVLSIAGWNGHCGFFRGAGNGDTFGNSERANCSGFDHENARSECATRAAAENFDSWTRSGNTRWASGPYRNFPG